MRELRRRRELRRGLGYNVFRSGYLYPTVFEIRNVDCNFINNKLLKQLIKKCEILHLDSVKCFKNLNSVHGTDEGVISHLKDLRIEDCDDIEFLIAKKSMLEFSNLEELCLYGLPNLIGFAKDLDGPDLPIKVCLYILLLIISS